MTTRQTKETIPGGAYGVKTLVKGKGRITTHYVDANGKLLYTWKIPEATRKEFGIKLVDKKPDKPPKPTKPATN